MEFISLAWKLSKVMENKNSMKQACEKATLMVYDTRLELHVKTKDRQLILFIFIIQPLIVSREISDEIQTIPQHPKHVSISYLLVPSM